MKVGLNTKSGFRKYRYAREYHKLAKGVYRHVKVSFACDLLYHISISYCFLRSLSQREPTTNTSFITNRAHHQKLVGFSFHLQYRIHDLTLSLDQTISIEPPSLYTDAGLAARMHSRRLLRRTNGWWMCGMRHVGDLVHVRIHHAKTRRQVSLFVTYGTTLQGFGFSVQMW